MSKNGQAVQDLRHVMLLISDLEPLTISTKPLEPYLINLVEIIEHNPENVDQIKAEFVRLVATFPPGANHILQFVMHRYRWEEVRQALIDRASFTRNLNLRQVLADVLLAFDPDWPDRDLYETYRDG